MGISTHILDTSTGRPAAGVMVRLEHHRSDGWHELGHGPTDADGRQKTLLPPDAAPYGVYRLTFDTASYLGAGAFFPEVQIVFAVQDDRHHHVPLLLSPFGYSTYRGS
jgi:5-hydroxyisourate hydrolase